MLNNDDNIFLPSVNLLTTKQLADQEDGNASSDTGNKQKGRIFKLFEELKTDESNLTADEADLLRELVREYSDIFALDSMQLGTTDLVTYSIDTGDRRPILQPLRRIPFALQHTVEEMDQKMMAQGEIQIQIVHGLAQ